MIALQNTIDWKEKFNVSFTYIGGNQVDQLSRLLKPSISVGELKDFIDSILSARDEEVMRKLEGLKMAPSEFEKKEMERVGIRFPVRDFQIQNKAIDDAIFLIRETQKEI